MSRQRPQNPKFQFPRNLHTRRYLSSPQNVDESTLSTIALVSYRLHDVSSALLLFGLQLRQLRSTEGVCRLWHCKLLFQRLPALGLETTQAVLRTMSSLQGFCKSVDDGAKGVFGSTFEAHASSNS